MESSFYYFFSATPQVLGGILALFGVFVVFKIQTIKKQLIGIGQSIIDEIDKLGILYEEELVYKVPIKSTIGHIKKAMHREDIVGLKRIFDLIDNQYFIVYKQTFNEVYEFHHNLICRTIIISVFTAFITFLCLASIPFSVYILDHPFLLYYLFIIIVDGIFISLYGLIYILIRSLKEPNYTMFPN